MGSLRNLINSKWVELGLRYVLGITFVYASMHKIAAPAEFAKIIYGYDLFPHMTINLIAIIIPFLELFTGLALTFGIYRKAAGALICGMLLVFIAAISFNLIRGHEFDCGCFSFSRHTTKFSTHYLLVRDIFLLLVGLYLIRFSTGHSRGLMENKG